MNTENIPTAAPVHTITFTIDGKVLTVPKGTTVYNAAKAQGIDIPIFCYHDRMPPFGACRMCLVEVEKMPKLQASCTLEASEGMIVKSQSEVAVDGRKGIIEFLLTSHPLDCPICDKGGECPLQDQSIENGSGESRFYEDKRHFKKHLSLGPVLKLDRERCIVCARCTRFGDLVSGDHALEFMDRGYKTEVGTPDGGPAKSKFIGNTIMICPVGALTSDVYRFRARPWDNKPTETTCTLCPVGCSMILDERDGEIMRTRSCENQDVNDIWLCDKGWFGYEFNDHEDRLQKPLIRRNGVLQEASWEEALTLVASKMSEGKSSGKLAAFGGNPLTVEENYLFQKFMREGLAVNHLDHRIGMPIIALDDEGFAPGMEMSIGECEHLSYAIICGLDLTEEFPVVWLRLKQAINKGAKVYFIGHFAPEIEQYLAKVVLHAPGEELKIIRQHLPEIAELTKSGQKGALFVGSQYLNSPQRQAILSELSQLKQNTSSLKMNLLEGRGNSYGARLAGMRPDLNPLGERLSNPGLNALQVLEEAAKSGWNLLYVAGADPAKKFPAKLWQEARSKIGFLVVQDLFLTETAKHADVVLPTLSYVEKRGSFVNIEGRLQKIQPGKEIPEDIYSDGEIFMQLAHKLQFSLTLDKFFMESLKQDRLKLNRSDKLSGVLPSNVASPTGSLLATFTHVLFDHGVRMRHNHHTVQLAQEPFVRIHPSEGTKRTIRCGDEVSLSANGSAIRAKVKLDARVSPGTAVLPLGFNELPVQDLGNQLFNGMVIELNKME